VLPNMSMQLNFYMHFLQNKTLVKVNNNNQDNVYSDLIHDLLFLPISTIDSRVSYRVVTHSCGLFTLE